MKTLGILLAGLTLTACSTAGDSDTGGPRPDKEDGTMAEVMCEEFVKDQLKAPATAEFSHQQHRETGEQRWDVTGTVDSENSFGALIRGSYRCDIRYLGKDQWRAKHVEVD